MGSPLVEASAHTNHVVKVYSDRVEVQSGWQGQQVESIGLRDIENVTLKGLVNCTLIIKTNKGKVFDLKRMALPEARRVKATVEDQKSRAGLYD
ncbi:PH domain-containing protein [Rubrobacter indicoceani]|uniref:PH domain-containing protein n=1 Tax=Rubrobacter indicoceani TaxID=2051957 RepID=UPI000E5B37CF|nr:PH domain-containing protein [Rubrobacter indicoceani]